MIIPFNIRIITAITLYVIVFAYFFVKVIFNSKPFSTKFIARSAVFAAISIILYTVPIFHISLPIFPSFLEIHLDEIPALIACFAYGPLSGVVVILIKTIAKLPLTTSACVGEFADLIYSIAFILPASIIYKKKRNIKGAILALIVSGLIQIIVSSFLTTFVMLDIYAILYPGLTKDVILQMCQIINPGIKDLNFSFLLLVAAPFNALKDVIVILFTLLLYKRLHSLIDKIGAQKN